MKQAGEEVLRLLINSENSFSAVNGANVFDGFNKLLYVTLRGGEAIDIITKPAVYISFSLPPIPTDEIFDGENIVQVIAA